MRLFSCGLKHLLLIINLRDGFVSACDDDRSIRYWADVLGMEHMNWGTGPTLQCGFTSVTSCRDLARVAQFWLNDGVWATDGSKAAGGGADDAAAASQVMNAEYARKGRTNVFPNKGKDYGYTLWREEGLRPGTFALQTIQVLRHLRTILHPLSHTHHARAPVGLVV